MEQTQVFAGVAEAVSLRRPVKLQGDVELHSSMDVKDTAGFGTAKS